MNIPDTNALKTRFAEALLRTPDDPFKAAFAAIPETGIALEAARNWVNDPFVNSEKLRLISEHGERFFLPTKEEQAREIYRMATDKSVDEENRLKAHRLFAEIMGHIEKPSQGAGTTNILNQGVMIVKDHGTDSDWEQKSIAQQHLLIADA